LLALDHHMTNDLLNLKVDTLVKMFVNYVQNAKDVNNKMEMLVGAMQTTTNKRKNTLKSKTKEVYS
jgi:hypothetical protein